MSAVDLIERLLGLIPQPPADAPAQTWWSCRHDCGQAVTVSDTAPARFVHVDGLAACPVGDGFAEPWIDGGES